MFVRESKPRLGRSLALLLLGFGACVASPGLGGVEEPAVSLAPERPGPLILDDPVEPLVPSRPRTEADLDRVEALSLFAAARMHERQREFPEALRLYQRALRFDPTALPVAQAIVSLTIRLNREQEALVYIVKMTDLEESPPPAQLEEVGSYLFQSGDLDGAIHFYERALAAVVASGDKPAEVARLRLVLGRFFVAAEKFGEGADCFAKTMEALDHPEENGIDAATRARMLPDPARVYHLFGETFMMANRLDEAAAAFEKVHELEPDEALVQFNRARVSSKRKEYPKALEALDASFVSPPDDLAMAPYDLLGEVLEGLGRGAEFTERLEKLTGANPDNLAIQLAFAEQLEKAQQIKRAEAIYRQLVDKTPIDLGFRGLARVYREEKRPDALLDLLAEVLRRTQVIETLGSELGDIAGDGGTMKALVEAARERYRTKPKEFGFDGRYGVALLALEANQRDEAAEFFELALDADPKRASDVLLVWGIGLMLDDQSSAAADVFRRAIADPTMVVHLPNLYFLLSGSLVADEKIDEALAAAKKAVELQPDSSALASRVAWVLYHAHRFDEAYDAYVAFIEKFGDDYSSRDTRIDVREARLILSNLCVLKDDMPQAEEWLQQVLDEFPEDPGASNDLGYLWADQGKHLERSLRMIQLAVDAEPENPAYLDSLGWVLFRLERYDEAVAHLRRAVEADTEPDAVILDHLGDALLKADQPQQAAEAWQKAVEAFQKAEEPDKAKAIQEKIKSQPSSMA